MEWGNSTLPDHEAGRRSVALLGMSSQEITRRGTNMPDTAMLFSASIKRKQ